MTIWTYLPKINSRRFRPVSTHHFFDEYANRRMKRKQYWRLLNTFILFMFLTIVGKIGLAMILPLQDLTSYCASLYANGIKTPFAVNSESLNISYHSVSYISLDKNLVLKYNGKLCELQDISVLAKADQMSVSYIRSPIPRQIFDLIIDEDVPMSEVHKLMHELQKCGWILINYQTRKKK